MSAPPDELHMRFGANVVTELERQGHDAKWLAAQLGWIANGQWNLERYLGLRAPPKFPRPALWLRMAEILGVDPARLIHPLPKANRKRKKTGT